MSILNFFNNNKYSNYYNKDTKKLFLPNNFSDDIKSKNFPKDVEEIEFDTKTPLTITDSFNKSIDDLPDTIKILSLSYGFNQVIKKLPNNLIKLILGSKYDQPLDEKIIPHTLEHIEFGDGFNQEINNLPSTIKHLTIGYRYGVEITKFPDLLESLEIRGNYPFSLKNIPNTLRTLKIGYSYDKCLDDLPNSITHLILNNRKIVLNKFPASITHLELLSGFEQKIGCYVYEQDKFMIPEGITHLTLGDSFKHSIDDLPKSIRYLKLGYVFNQSLDNLPPNVEEIIIDDYFTVSSSNLPSSIQKITVRKEKQKELFTKLPFGCEIVVIPANRVIHRVGGIRCG